MIKTNSNDCKLNGAWPKRKRPIFPQNCAGDNGDSWKAPRGQQIRLEKLRKREDQASEAIFAWLDVHSPRNFRVGVPANWVCDRLTYADAITAGRMSVTPPCYYGAYPSDMVRFAAALPVKETILEVNNESPSLL